MELTDTVFENQQAIVDLGVRINLAEKGTLREQVLQQEVSWLRSLVRKLKVETKQLKQRLGSFEAMCTCRTSTRLAKKTSTRVRKPTWKLAMTNPKPEVVADVEDFSWDSSQFCDVDLQSGVIDGDFIVFTEDEDLLNFDVDQTGNGPDQEVKLESDIIANTLDSELSKSERKKDIDEPYVFTYPEMLIEVKAAVGRVPFNEVTRRYSCPNPGCTNTYKDRRDVFDHYLVHRPDLRPYKCKNCQKTFGRRRTLQSHYRQCSKVYHDDTFQKVMRILTNVSSNEELRSLLQEMVTRDETTKEYICPACQKKSRKFSDAFRHFRTHKPELKPLKCICGRFFESHNRLKQHEVRCKYKVLVKTAVVKQENEGDAEISDESNDNDVSSPISTDSTSPPSVWKTKERSQRRVKTTKTISMAQQATKLILKREKRNWEKRVLCSKCGLLKKSCTIEVHQEQCNGLPVVGGQQNPPREPIHQCTDCERKYVSITKLNVHRVKVHGHKKHSFCCTICLIKFVCQEDLENHVSSTHKDETPREIEQYQKFKCGVCDKLFINCSGLRSHLKSHVIKPFFCNICKKKFHTEPELKNHSKRTKCGKSYFCKICSTTFYNGQGLSKHMKSLHPDTTLSDSPTAGVGEILEGVYSAQDSVTRFQSGLDAFPLNLELSEDLSLLANNDEISVNPITGKVRKRYKCTICSRVEKTYLSLQLHIKLFHTTPGDERIQLFKCPECLREFLRQDRLDDHFNRIHRQIKQFSCHLCDVKFTANCSLQRHVRAQHTERGNKPFPCRYCSRRFIDMYRRQDHERLHTRILPFACHFCPSKYASLGNLSSHLRRCHEGSKKANDEVCVIDASGVGRIVQNQS